MQPTHIQDNRFLAKSAAAQARRRNLKGGVFEWWRTATIQKHLQINLSEAAFSRKAGQIPEK